MTADTLTILRHSLSSLAKTWNPDGTITGYGEAKYFSYRTAEVGSLSGLSNLLHSLQAEPHAMLIRGRYVGDRVARKNDGTDFKPGKVRRALDYFEDQALHTVLIDIDKFEPLSADPLVDPTDAICEYIQTMLPKSFAHAGYHWQLSNSHGHPSKGATLSAHLWMWLDKPLTSAQLRAYAKEVRLATDLSLFNSVQAHYTAAPVFHDFLDPVDSSHRSGFEAGVSGGALYLDLSEQAFAAVDDTAGGRGARMATLAGHDPVAQALADKGMIKGQRRDGGINIVCPFEDAHTAASNDSATQYFMPNTGGYASGSFKCLHAHCLGRKRAEFLARLGVDEYAAMFADLDRAGGGRSDGSDVGAGQRASDSGSLLAISKITPAEYLCTDLANANRIEKYFGKHLFVIGNDWYCWSGKVWLKEDADVYRNTCNLGRLITQEAAQWSAKPTKNDEEAKANAAVAKALMAHAKRSENIGPINAAIALLKKALGVRADTVNKNIWLLNCANGTVDLRTGALLAHNPADRITRMIQMDYVPGAKSPTWEAVLAKITLEDGLGQGKPIARFLQRWFGYCATGSVVEHKMVIHFGGGQNGKSTVLDTIDLVLGDYSGTAAPGLLMASKSDKHPTEIASMFGKRMVTAHESAASGQLKEDFVKSITGGDNISARFMYGDFFDFAPTHKIQLLTNYKPTVKGQDKGIWRRLLLVPYLAKFGVAAEVQAGAAHYVKDLKIHEYIGAELEGVLAWIVEGARLWYTDGGLKEPDLVLLASADYQSEQDRVLQYITECCQCDMVATTPLTGSFGLLDSYVSWCQESGFKPLSKNKFVDEVGRVVPGFKTFDKQDKSKTATQRRRRYCSGIRVLDAE